jgi:hypothetical protein
MMQSHISPAWTKALPLGAIALAAAVAPACPANAQTAAPAKQAVVYAKCMRQHGFADFPDPDSEGRILFRARLDARSMKAVRAAHKSCNDVAPPGWRSERPDPDRRAKLLGFAQCVRAKGVADFPDPGARGAFDFDRIADSPTLRIAMADCRRITGLMVGFGG